MPQKPFTITRVPKPRRVAAASQPARRATPSETSVCPVCAAVIADAELHGAFHHRTDRWAQRLNEVVHALVAAAQLSGWKNIPGSEGRTNA